MDLKALIFEYYRSSKHLQLATTRGGMPWICTIYFVSDNDLNLYWFSLRSRQHSAEIHDNHNVAAAIVKDADHKQALQITGEAMEVGDDDLQRVKDLYTSKFGPKNYDVEKMKLHNPNDGTFWVLKPHNISLWDEVNFPDDPRQTYQLG